MVRQVWDQPGQKPRTNVYRTMIHTPVILEVNSRKILYHVYNPFKTLSNPTFIYTAQKIQRNTILFFSIYHSVKHPKFKPHLKTIQNNPEYLLLLHHLNNASKSLTTRNLIQEMSFKSFEQCSKAGVYIGILKFLIYALKIDCGYSLEPMWQFIQYPKSMFWAEIWKIKHCHFYRWK